MTRLAALKEALATVQAELSRHQNALYNMVADQHKGERLIFKADGSWFYVTLLRRAEPLVVVHGRMRGIGAKDHTVSVHRLDELRARWGRVNVDHPVRWKMLAVLDALAGSVQGS